MSTVQRVIVVLAVVVVVGCSAPSQYLTRESAAAGSIQDVIDAWNAVCADHHFRECPPNAGQAGCIETMGSMYTGCAFAFDCGPFMQAIKAEFFSGSYPAPEVDDTLNCIIEDPAWFQ